MSLSTSLANALSGLRVNSRLTAAASNNLANALTPGYGRQTLEVGSLSLAGEGAGVRVISANRAASPGLTAARRNADGEAALLAPQSEALSRLGSVLGEPTDIDGLFRRLETFETTLRQFAETPESQPRQIQVVNDARDLTGILNQISSEVATLRQSADFDIATDVATVNRNLYSIQELNQRIQLLSSADQNFAILVDQRERLIDEVSAIVPVQI
ncbi:MAG: flagellar hook-associated protein FlgK, partial [Pseudomonadota bacterium]